MLFVDVIASAKRKTKAAGKEDSSTLVYQACPFGGIIMVMEIHDERNSAAMFQLNRRIV
jgi:hypothetical protein